MHIWNCSEHPDFSLFSALIAGPGFPLLQELSGLVPGSKLEILLYPSMVMLVQCTEKEKCTWEERPVLYVFPFLAMRNFLRSFL